MRLLLGKTDEFEKFPLLHESETFRKHQIELLTFGSRNADILIDFVEEDFSKLQNQLVLRKFSPDVAIIFTGGSGYLLSGIEAASFPVALFNNEWFLSAQNLHYASRRIDFIFSFPGKSQNYLQNLTGKEPLVTSYPSDEENPERYPLLSGVEKIYDVAYLGFVNPWNHPDRTKFLAKLASLPKDLNVFIGETRAEDGKVSHEQINLFNNRSKICVNFSHPHDKVVNSRIVRALQSGAFMLTEHLIDEKEFGLNEARCGFYTLENLEGEIRYYLDHAEKREKIAKNAMTLIDDRIFSMSRTILKMIEALKSNKTLPTRKIDLLSRPDQLVALGTEAFLSQAITGERGIKKSCALFKKAISLQSNHLEAINNLGVALATQLFSRNPDSTVSREKILELFRHCQTIHTCDAISRYNEACFYKKEKRFKDFQRVFIRVSELFERFEGNTSKAFPYVGILLVHKQSFLLTKKRQELFFHFFEMGEPTSAFYSALKKYLLWSLNVDMAEFLVEQGQLEAAALHYEEASLHMPDDDNALREWGNLVGRAGDFKKARDILMKSLEVNPLNIMAAQDLIAVLISLGKYQEAKELADHFVLMCQRISVFNTSVGIFEGLLKQVPVQL